MGKETRFVGGIPIIGSGDIREGGAAIKTSHLIAYAVGTHIEGETFPTLMTDDEGRFLLHTNPEEAERDALALMVMGEVDNEELVVFPVGIVVADHILKGRIVVVRKPAKN